jgi:hypothetical protein
MGWTILQSSSAFTRLSENCGSFSANVVSQAERVMQRIVETYNLPNRDFHNPEDRRRQSGFASAFSEACREDLCV